MSGTEDCGPDCGEGPCCHDEVTVEAWEAALARLKDQLGATPIPGPAAAGLRSRP